jgi:uncharacterized membrane protein (UPF0136 family)
MGILVINLILCIVILVLGVMGYKRSQSAIPLYIGIAFGLFGLSHLAALFGLKESLTGLLILVRLTAYLIVVFAVYKIAFSSKKA